MRKTLLVFLVMTASSDAPPPAKTRAASAASLLTLCFALVVAGVLGVIYSLLWKVDQTESRVARVAEKVLDRFVPQTEVWNHLLDAENFGPEARDEYVVAAEGGRETRQRTKSWSVLSKLVVQVSYNYHINCFVPLNDRQWSIESFASEDSRVRVRVRVPELQSSKKQIVVSRIEPKTTNGSLFYDQNTALAELLAQIEGDLLEKSRSGAKTQRIREQARQTIREFVRKWVLKSFADSAKAKALTADAIEVTFADEASP